MDLAPAVRNFVYLLIDHRRTEMLGEIQQAFETRTERAPGHRRGGSDFGAEAERAGAAAADRGARAAHRQEDSKRASARMNRCVGGAVVRVGSTVYDGSVREQLTRLRAQLETE